MKICTVGLFVFVFVVARSALLEEDRPPTFLTASVGGYVVFNCPLNFPHDIEIPYILYWIKDENYTIYSWYDGALSAMDEYAGRIQLLDSGEKGWGKGSINLTAIRDTDSGWYECRVLFPNRTPNSRNNGTWFHLEVDGGNLITVPPINQTTMEGAEAQFSCKTKQSETFVKWFKDGDAIADLPDLSTRSYVQDGTLVIKSTMMGDLGEYQCVAVNSLGERQAARAFLNVQYKAKVVYAPRELYLPYGRSAMLDCHFRANPPLTNLRWEKDGFLFDPYNVQGVFYRPNGSLYFNKVDETHGGQYSCTPYNELGTEGASPHITVVVQRPPSFLYTPHNLYLRKLGDTLEMPCDAIDSDNLHRPTIMWTKNGERLPDGRYTINGGNITIENINEEDRGMYTCSASNEAATITAETELMIENVPPRAPYNLVANSSENALTLRWTAGYSRPYMQYNVWYRPIDVAEWRTLKVFHPYATEATIPSLSPGREYEVMVLCQDKYGDGMFSKSLRVWTKGIGERMGAEEYRTPLGSFMQIGPPGNVSVSLTTEGYLVTWSAPELGRETLRLYVVKWTQGPLEFLQGSVETKETYFLIRHLEEDQVYQFQVYAMSYNDYQAPSAKVILQVPSYWKIRAVVAGTACSVILFAMLAAAVVYHVRSTRAKRHADKLHSDKNNRNGGR